jgi:hypothetical protein
MTKALVRKLLAAGAPEWDYKKLSQAALAAQLASVDAELLRLTASWATQTLAQKRKLMPRLNALLDQRLSLTNTK